MTDAAIIEQEHEVAWTVSDADLGWLLSYERDRTIIHNVYYDDGTRILDAGGTFRVRYTLDDFGRRKVPAKVTLKLVKGFAGDVRHAVETTGEFCSPEPPERLHSKTPLLPIQCRATLSELGITVLTRLGMLPCIRRRLRTDHGLLCDLDTAELPGGTLLHEIEFESDDPAEHELCAEWIRTIARSAQLSRTRKHERFRQAIRM